jgi:uncharacterized protein
VKIEFDAAKNIVNRDKHGISLGDAARLDWNQMIVSIDLKREYGEIREIGLAPLGDRVYFVAFVRRQGVIRIIGLRKANNREIRKYEKNKT